LGDVVQHIRILVLTALAFALALPTASAAAEKLKGPQVGDVAPELLGRALDGAQISTTDYKGKVVIVTFWATWCPPCRKELPILERVQTLAGDSELQVIAINVEDRDVFRRAAKALKVARMKVTHDARGSISRAYGRGPIPHMVIIGRDGRVQTVKIGYSEKSLDSLAEEINKALQASTAP
jgi:thiol-disulfide isomerase/thioredoxin